VGKLEGTVAGDQGEPLRVGIERGTKTDGRKTSPSPLYRQIVRVSVQVLGSAWLIYHELFFIRANVTEATDQRGIRGTSTPLESLRLLRQRAEGGISRNANLIEFPLAAGGRAEGQKNKISRDSMRSPLVAFQRNLGDNIARELPWDLRRVKLESVPAPRVQASDKIIGLSRKKANVSIIRLGFPEFPKLATRARSRLVATTRD